MVRDDTDTDSYSESMSDTDDAAVVINALLATFQGDDARQAINPDELAMLLNAYDQLQNLGNNECDDAVAKICYKICRIASRHRINPAAIASVVAFIDLMINKGLSGELNKPKVLSKKSFVDVASSALNRLKKVSKKTLKDKSLGKQIEAVEEKLDRLTYSIYYSASSSTAGHGLYSEKKAIDFLTKSEKLAHADHYFQDWDETLYDSRINGLYVGLSDLIQIAALLGIKQHIITARHEHADNAKKYLLIDEVRNVGRFVRSPLNHSIHDQVQLANVSHIYKSHNVIYCNFHNVRLDDDVVMVIKGPAVKSKKIENFYQYCENKAINPKAALIFDDKQDVWTDANGKRMRRLHLVKNSDPRKSTFTKMTHAISQRILYNETIDLDKRIAAANQLHLQLQTQGPLYERLAATLKTFAAQGVSLVQKHHS